MKIHATAIPFFLKNTHKILEIKNTIKQYIVGLKFSCANNISFYLKLGIPILTNSGLQQIFAIEIKPLFRELEKKKKP